MPPFLGLSSTAWKNLRLACALSRARDKAHARRYFFQALQLNAKDLVALGIVVEIDKLFELEADAKAAGLGAAERLELRPQRAQPIVEALKAKVKPPEHRRCRVALWANATTPWDGGVS
jgi:Transposase IS66 family